MTERALVFTCEGEELVAILHAPEAQACRTGVLVVVGGPQYRVGSHRQFVLLARDLAAAGYPVMRFDYRGMGDSSGSMRTFEDVSTDIGAAIEAFQTQVPDLDGVAVFGLCDAASAAMIHCATDARVRRLILANPWVRTEATAARTAVRHYYARRWLQRTFWKKLLSGQFRLWHSLGEFLGSLSSSWRGGRTRAGVTTHFIDRMRAGLEGFEGSVLLLMSDQDLTAREFDELCQSSADWKRCIAARKIERQTVVDADHTFSSATAAKAVSAMVASWLGRAGSR